MSVVDPAEKQRLIDEAHAAGILNPNPPAVDAPVAGGQLPPIEPVPVKPGWKTSEWYATLFTQIIGLLVTLGVVKPDVGTDPTTTQAVQIAAGVAAMVIPQIAYAYSRARVKHAALTATATAQAAARS